MSKPQKKYPHNNDLFVIVGGDVGVCYLASSRYVRHVASLQMSDLHRRNQTSDESRVSRGWYNSRFHQYAGAVITAISNQKNVRQIYLCGKSRDVARIYGHMPRALQQRSSTNVSGVEQHMNNPTAQKIYDRVLSGNTKISISPFST